MLIHNTLLMCLTLLRLATASAAFDGSNQPSSLTIKILNIKKNSGNVVVGLYKDESTWLKNPLQKVSLPTNEESKTALFDVPPGKYAISIYQDVNGNGKLDQNFLGIPKEPIGFGNNYKPFGKPKFESAMINYMATSKPEVIKLVKAI